MGFRKWVGVGRTWGRFLEKLGQSQVGNLDELFTGVLPVAVVDQDWSDISRDIYGMWVFSDPVSGAAETPVCSIITLRDIWLHKVTAINFTAIGDTVGGEGLHLFTPDNSYRIEDFFVNLFVAGLRTEASGLDGGAFGLSSHMPTAPALAGIQSDVWQTLDFDVLSMRPAAPVALWDHPTRPLYIRANRALSVSPTPLVNIPRIVRASFTWSLV